MAEALQPMPPCLRAPTPLSRARAMNDSGLAPVGSPAALVLLAAEPWSPNTHALFPDAARERAVALMRLGHLLSMQPRFEGEEQSLVDCWLGVVMPRVIER